LLLCAPCFLRGQVLLIVDDSNPSNVTFTATGNNAGAYDSSTTEAAGVDLLNFFANAIVGSYLASGTLTPAGNGTAAYNQATIDNYSVTGIDLNYRNGSLSPDADQIFDPTLPDPALHGMDWVNFFSVDFDLPAPGTFGNILSGNSTENSGVIIGTWEAVPEPANTGLAAGLAALAAGAGSMWWNRRVNQLR
jgi:hypothetical protein